jgi:kynurenine 3-monooxygenase
MTSSARIAIVGGGPSGLLVALALARRGIGTTIFERDQHPEIAPRYDPDRSYTIDISGHGRKAILHTGITAAFDERMIPFRGLTLPNGGTARTEVPGWTGSRGDIVRSLMAPIVALHAGLVTFHHETKITAADVEAGTLTHVSPSGTLMTETFDFIIGGDGTGSVVREAMRRQVPGFTVRTASYPNYCTMIELDRVDDGTMDREYIHGLSTRPFTVAGAIKGDQGGR